MTLRDRLKVILGAYTSPSKLDELEALVREEMASRDHDPSADIALDSEAMADLLKRAARAALCLEAWAKGFGPHDNVRDISGALAKTVRLLIATIQRKTART